MSLPSIEEIRSLAGHQFRGGKYTIAHWENYLMTECTGAEPMPSDLAHPVALFHVPILGAGTSIAEMFELGQAESGVSIGIESYEWQFHQSLREELEYTITGEITEADRINAGDNTYDRIQFRFDLHDGEQAAATTLVTWRYRRTVP